MSRDAFSFLSSRHTVRTVAITAGLILLVAACGASGGEGSVGAGSSELYVGHSCETTGACPAAGTSVAACNGTPGCAWTGTGESCTSGCLQIQTAEACKDAMFGDAGYIPCIWENGACAPTFPCPTGPDATLAACVAVWGCSWTDSCAQTSECNAKATTKAACLASNPQCQFSTTVAGCPDC